MILQSLRLSLCLSFFAFLARVEASIQTFFPASIPLANRSPYLNAWFSPLGDSFTQGWPQFWDQTSMLGWVGRIRVDNVSYQWMGADLQPPFTGNITDIRITPTRSFFTMLAGPMNITVTFLSPIEPADWVLQSLPFSYVYIEAAATDGLAHDVQVYSHITADWLSGDRNSVVTWSHQTADRSLYHEIQLQSPEANVELNNSQAQDGTGYYAMADRPNLTWEISTGVAFKQFAPFGNLTNTASTAFAPIQPNFMIFSFAVDLGRIRSIQDPVVWAVGYVRDPSIAYTSPNSTVQQLSPYFVTKYGFNNIGAAIDDFTTNFNDTLARAIAFDNTVLADAAAVSPHYADLVSLAIRQTLSTLDITVSKGSDGNPNASDVRIFVKDIGSGATTARVTPVERMYAAMPALLYVNASLLGPLLSPLLDAQSGGSSTPYAAQDLGLGYPNATGTRGPHNRGVEQTGNMLIMLYAHAKFSGEGYLIQKHYGLAKRWADYLVNNTLTPSNQLSADNEGTANMTNLAIKGIIGVQAMSEISRALGEESDAERYSRHATALVGQWQSLAMSPDQQHFLGVYGNEASWALMYNLYADRLLGTNLVDRTSLQGQAAFYDTLLISAPKFGLALDNTAPGTSAAWTLFTAAIMPDNNVRDKLIESVWNRVTANTIKGAFPDQYDVDTGLVLMGEAGPAAGGVFSILALNLPPKNITVSLTQAPSPSPSAVPEHNGRSSKPVGAIVGCVMGGVFFIVLLGFGVSCVMRRRPDDPEQQIKAAGPALSPYTYHPRDTRRASASYDTVAYQGSTLRPSSLSSLSGVSNVPTISAFIGSKEEPSPVPSRERRSPPHTRDGQTASPEGRRPPLPPTDVLGLRTEVDNLRREMLEMRVHGLEPPPEYTG